MQDDISNYFTPGTDSATVTSTADAPGSLPQRAYSAEYNYLGIKTNLVIPISDVPSANNAGIKNVIGTSNNQTTQSPVSSAGNVQSSQSVGFESGVGWYMGYKQGVPVFYVGNYPSRYIAWDGTTFFIEGDFVVGNSITLAPGDNIQTAINTLAPTGGTINLESGTYTQSSDITLAAGVSIFGAGPLNTIIDFNSTSHGIKASGTPGPTTEIDGFTLSGFQVTGSHATAAIDLTGCSSFSLEKLEVTLNTGIAIRIQKSWLFKCDNIYMYLNGGDDFQYITDNTQAATAIYLQNLTSWAPGGYGFKVTNTGQDALSLTFMSCLSEQATSDGFYIDIPNVNLTNCTSDLPGGMAYNLVAGGSISTGCR